MRVDFYQLSRDPLEKVVPLLAGKVLDSGARLLIVAEEENQRQHLADALWKADGFLANGMADAPHAERQPILLAGTCNAPNGAMIVLLADGVWHEEASGFARAMLLFGAEQAAAARNLWQTLGTREGLQRHIFKQTPQGAWREGA